MKSGLLFLLLVLPSGALAQEYGEISPIIRQEFPFLLFRDMVQPILISLIAIFGLNRLFSVTMMIVVIIPIAGQPHLD
jgi:hypothetical protein